MTIVEEKFRTRPIEPFNRFYTSAERIFHKRNIAVKSNKIAEAMIQYLVRFMPIVSWLPRYSWRDSFFADLSAGLTMAVFSVPTGIAHATICGVAPVYGLYTAIFPTFFYLLFGNSKHNALGGFAILSLMTRSAIEKVYRLMQTLNSNSTLLTNVTSAITAAAVLTAQQPSQPIANIPLTTTTTMANFRTLITNESLLNESSVFGTGAETSFFEGEFDLDSNITSILSNGTDPAFLKSSLLDDPVLTALQSGDMNQNGKLDSGSGTANVAPTRKMVTQFGDVRPIHIATTIVFLSAIFQILMGIFRLDFLSCYLSEQVMSGFVVGGCVHVFFSQIGDVLGIQLPARSGRGYLYHRLMDLFQQMHQIHTPTTIISCSSVGFLLFSQRILEPWLASVFRFPIPYELILVILGITATNFAKLSKRHSITVVGHVPTIFPPPAFPRLDLASLVFFDALSITITAVAIHLTVVKIVEKRYHYRINSCQELYSLGFAGLFSAAFPVFPVTSIFARTLIGDADKNSTQMTVCFSSLALLAVILFIGPALEYLPKCILASMVVVSLTASFSKFREVRALWPLFKFDFIIFVVSLLLTVCYDMAEGLTFTIIFAIFTIVVRDQWPKWHFLSHDEEINDYKETPKEQMHIMGSMDACVLRYDAPLIFTSVHKFIKVVSQGVKRWERRDLTAAASSASIRSSFSNDHLIGNTSNKVSSSGNYSHYKIPTKNESNEANNQELYQRKSASQQQPLASRSTTLIIDCSGFPYVDYQGLCTLKRIYKDFSSEGVTVKFAAPKAVLMRMFRDTDFMDTVPTSEIFSTVRQAVTSCTATDAKQQTDSGKWNESRPQILRTLEENEEMEEEEIQLMFKIQSESGK